MRAASAVVGALGFAALGFALGRGCAPSREPAPPEIPPRSESATPRDELAPVPKPSRHAPTKPADDASAADEIAESPPLESPGAGAGSADVPDFPSVDVEVVWPNGDPAANAFLYARPAGQTSADSEPPIVECGAAGRARVPVVIAGRYDVGAVVGAFQVMATDVEIPRAALLRLVLPEPCVVTVHMPDRGGPVPPDGVRPEHNLVLRVAADPRASYPGRGETSDGCAATLIGAPGTVWQPPAPRGAKCVLECDARFRAEPETFVAPADVRLIALPRYPVTVRIEWRPPERRFDKDVYISAQFLIDGSHGWQHFWNAELPAGTTLALGTGAATFDAEFDKPDGTLRWQWQGVVSGSVPFHGLSEETRTTIVATVELDPAVEPTPVARPEVPQSEPGDGPSFRVEGSSAADGRAAQVYVVSSDGVEDAQDVPAGTATRIRIGRPGWAIAWQGDSVSRPVAVNETTTGEVQLRLAKGGWLVLVPSARPPLGLGEPRVERADGQPFCSDEGGTCGTWCELRTGNVLGPLPVGVTEFKVTIDGHVVATASAEVRAGSYEPLRIPHLRAQ